MHIMSDAVTAVTCSYGHVRDTDKLIMQMQFGSDQHFLGNGVSLQKENNFVFHKFCINIRLIMPNKSVIPVFIFLFNPNHLHHTFPRNL
jgi:hypothetical protein